ncbi:MAG: DEAD/DEAH box helicase, partial [Vulcanisaeta sp.]
ILRNVSNYDIDINNIKDLIRKYLGTCFKTAHGELIRLYRYETALPEQVQRSSPFETPPYRVLEAYVLPFMEEPMPEFKPENFKNFCKSLTERLGSRLSEYAKAICKALKSIRVTSIHDYQYTMLSDLIENFDRPKLVILSAPTASGKTEIFMTYLVTKLLVRDGVAVIIYPTKTLAREQLERFVRFLYNINNSGLDKKIRIYILDGDSPSSINEVKGKRFRGGISVIKGNTNGVVKYDDNGEVVIDWGGGNIEKVDWISEYKDLRELEEPAIVITNHSMLSTHLNDGSSWVKSLARLLNTIVVDEAHIFINDKEKSDFLHFLILRLLVMAVIEGGTAITNGFINNPEVGIKELVSGRGLDVILSSATLSDRDVLPQGVATSQLGGIDLHRASMGSGGQPPIDVLLRWLYGIYSRNF